ncbi:MAG TPA: ABC transporter substrate-binding protein [Methylomirabilota bacterium]
MTLTRRAVVSGIVTLAITPGRTSAQPDGRVRRVGIFAQARSTRDDLVGALRARGWSEGRNLAVDWHSAERSETQIGDYLARMPPDVLVMAGPHRIRAAMRATTAIPIIGIDLESDPVVGGFVTTLARPGANVTGIWMDLPELAGKQIQFLREVVPRLQRLGVVWDDRIGQPQFSVLEAAARPAGIALLPAGLRATTEVEGVLKRVLAERPQAIVLLTAPVVFSSLGRIAELTHRSRMPSITPFSTYPSAGGLMAYGPDFPAMWLQLSSYIDRVLRGARAGDLPVERPSKFSLILNLKTARHLGLAISQSLIFRADEVIQ